MLSSVTTQGPVSHHRHSFAAALSLLQAPEVPFPPELLISVEIPGSHALKVSLICTMGMVQPNQSEWDLSLSPMASSKKCWAPALWEGAQQFSLTILKAGKEKKLLLGLKCGSFRGGIPLAPDRQ